jgi:hypothetical protein
MAKTINVTWQGLEASFGFKPVDRAALYGKRRRVAFDESGQACSRASLLADGSLLLKSGMTGQGYFLSDGVWVAQGHLEGLNPDGTPAAVVPSTLGESVSLEGPISIEEILDMTAETVYALDVETLPEGLSERLAAGDCFRFRFNFRDSYSQSTGILLSNSEGVWALIGTPVSYEWSELGRLVDVVADVAVEDDSDDLDFEMF